MAERTNHFRYIFKQFTVAHAANDTHRKKNHFHLIHSPHFKLLMARVIIFILHNVPLCLPCHLIVSEKVEFPNTQTISFHINSLSAFYFSVYCWTLRKQFFFSILFVIHSMSAIRVWYSLCISWSICDEARNNTNKKKVNRHENKLFVCHTFWLRIGIKCCEANYAIFFSSLTLSSATSNIKWMWYCNAV